MWKTTDFEASETDLFVSLIPGGFALASALYMTGCRAGKCTPSVGNLIPSFNARSTIDFLIYIPQALLVLFLVLGAADSGAKWFDVAVRRRPTANTGLVEAQLVADDCLVLAVSSFFIGGTVGGCSVRWVIENKDSGYKLLYVASLLTMCFFPLIFQATLVLTKSEAGSDRSFYFFSSIACQGATAVFLLLSVYLYAKRIEEEKEQLESLVGPTLQDDENQAAEVLLPSLSNLNDAQHGM